MHLNKRSLPHLFNVYVFLRVEVASKELLWHKPVSDHKGSRNSPPFTCSTWQKMYLNKGTQSGLCDVTKGSHMSNTFTCSFCLLRSFYRKAANRRLTYCFKVVNEKVIWFESGWTKKTFSITWWEMSLVFLSITLPVMILIPLSGLKKALIPAVVQRENPVLLDWSQPNSAFILKLAGYYCTHYFFINEVRRVCVPFFLKAADAENKG